MVTREGQAHVAVARDVKTAPGPMGPSTTGTAVVVPVTMGRSDAKSVSVMGELKEGDLAVTRGNETLRGGETLMVMNPPAAQGGAAPASQPTASSDGAGGMNGSR